MLKKLITLLLAALLLFTAACAEENTVEEPIMYITINGTTLTMTVADNAAARELLAMLADGPITVTTHGYGGWEQVGSLGFSLPAEDTWLTAEPGDVMLYCGNQIVLFYGNNGWDYTLLGHIQDKTADELKALLGSGEDTVVLSLEAPENE